MNISEREADDRAEFLDEGKPFATWRKADKVTRWAFREFRLARQTEWGELLSHVAEELERLRVWRDRAHKFLTKRYESLRAPLPGWMGAHF